MIRKSYDDPSSLEVMIRRSDDDPSSLEVMIRRSDDDRQDCLSQFQLQIHGVMMR